MRARGMGLGGALLALRQPRSRRAHCHAVVIARGEKVAESSEEGPKRGQGETELIDVPAQRVSVAEKGAKSLPISCQVSLNYH